MRVATGITSIMIAVQPQATPRRAVDGQSANAAKLIAAPMKAILDVACLEPKIAATTRASPASKYGGWPCKLTSRTASNVGQNNKASTVILRLRRYVSR